MITYNQIIIVINEWGCELKDSKTIIIITLIAAIVLAGVIGFATYKITLNNKGGTENKKSNATSSKKDDTANFLKVGNYTLQYGTYKGYSIEYDWDDEKGTMIESSKKEMILKLNSDNTYELSGEKHKFSVVGSNIIVPEFNNTTMLKVTGNNKLELQVGAGVEMTYSNEYI